MISLWNITLKILLALYRRVYTNNYLYIFKKNSTPKKSQSDSVICISSVEEFNSLLFKYTLGDKNKKNIVIQLHKGSSVLFYLCNNKISAYLFFTQKSLYTKEIGGEVIPGSSSVYVYHIYVFPSFRGEGIQSRLMDSVDLYFEVGTLLYISVLSNNFYSMKNIINSGFRPDGFVHVLFLFGIKRVIDYKKGSLDVSL